MPHLKDVAAAPLRNVAPEPAGTDQNLQRPARRARMASLAKAARAAAAPPRVADMDLGALAKNRENACALSAAG
jgi:hypothetical protein